MRTRDKIMVDVENSSKVDELTMEVLLDIRDLLKKQ